MKQFRVGVIGCGSISVMHLDSLKYLDETMLCAVCDQKPERARAAAEKYGAKPYVDYIEMLETENLDAVHLCLPHYLHVPAALEAMKRGVHVLSEKPMSIRYDEALQAVETAEKLNLRYGVILQCRYNTPAVLVKQRIADGRLGPVKCGRVVLTWYRPDDYYGHSDWKGTWDKEGGGVVIDQAIHSLDLANWMIASTPVRVQSSLHNRNHEIMKVEDTAEGLITYENGVGLSFFAMNNYLKDEPIEIRLLCEKGTVRLSYDEVQITYDDGTTEYADNLQEDAISYSGGKDYWGFRHCQQIREFYKAVGQGTDPALSGREALKIQKIICDIYNNNDSGVFGELCKR